MKFNPSDITSTYSAIAALNANFDDIATLFEQVVFRDGTSPNEMLANLDMNHFRIVNNAAPVNATDLVRLSDLSTYLDVPNGFADLLATDAGASLVGEASGGTVQDALDAFQAVQPQAQVQLLWSRIRAGQRNVRVLCVGDSTQDADIEWAHGLAEWFGDNVSTHDVTYSAWNDGSSAFASPTTLSSGSGSQTIAVENVGVSGSSGYFLEGHRGDLIFDGTKEYDLVIWNYGHNYGTTVTEDLYLPSFICQVSNIMARCPMAGILLTLQNPRVDAPDQTKNTVAAWLRVAMVLGVGVIDVYNAFLSHPDFGIAAGDPGSLYIDGTHPSTLGTALWLDTITSTIAEPVTYTRIVNQGRSPLLTQRKNYAPNPFFTDWAGSAPAGWTFTNTTASKDAGRIDTGLYSLRCTNGAGTFPFITTDLSNYLPHFRGKYITLLARVWKPTGITDIAGRCFLNASNGVTDTTATSIVRLPGESVDGWHWAMTTLLVPSDTTSLTASAFTGALNGSDVGKTVNFAAFFVFDGILPGHANIYDYATASLDNLYDAANTGIPSGLNGTLAATNDDIVLTGASGQPARVYINLPGAVPGQVYKVTWDHISDVPGNGGTVVLRNGQNGGGTVLDTVTWSTETMMFTAPSGSVSLVLIGNTGTTDFTINDWNVSAQSSGLQEAAVCFHCVRNLDGTVVDATGGSGKFKVVSTPGVSLYLQGEDTQNTMKEVTLTSEYIIPKEYILGRPLTVKVNAQVAGTGTLGSTKTLTLTAYEIANDGTQGSNIGPSAATLTTSAADYTFTLTGTSLAPNDRIAIKLIGNIVETANVNPIYVKVNSIRVL